MGGCSFVLLLCDFRIGLPKCPGSCTWNWSIGEGGCRDSVLFQLPCKVFVSMTVQQVQTRIVSEQREWRGDIFFKTDLVATFKKLKIRESADFWYLAAQRCEPVFLCDRPPSHK